MTKLTTGVKLVLLSVAVVACDFDDISSPQASRAAHGSCPVVSNGCVMTSQVILHLDPSRGEFPEGIAVDHRGNIFIGLRFPGTVLKFRPGEVPTVVAQFAATTSSGAVLEDQGLLGLEADRSGNLFAAVASFDPETGEPAATHGVWRISPTGDRVLVPGTESVFFPNALTFDPQGNLYISSSSGPPSGPNSFENGAIWRVPPGGTAQLWVRDPQLTGTGELSPEPWPIGANGVAYHGRSVFVANTEKRQIVKVPIRTDGSAGEVRVAASLGGSSAEGSFAGVVDGLAVDARGNLYPLLIGESRLVRVSPDGSRIETIADASDGLQTPTSLSFGSGSGATSVFIAEFAAFADQLGLKPQPKVVRVEVGVPAP